MKNKKAIKKLKREIAEIRTLLKLMPARTELQTIAKHVQNLEAEKEKNCSCKTYYTPMSATDLISNPEYTINHTNTQKEDKNATERQGEGEKEYLETIVTNEMFNEELESKLKKNILEYHPAFMLLNGVIPSNLIDDLIRAKLKSKGEHYSPNGDRYSNFKRLNNSTAKQKTAKERIENFMEKHEIWIEDYQAGDVSGTLLDLIESCIDVLCYKLLLDIYLKFNGEVKKNNADVKVEIASPESIENKDVVEQCKLSDKIDITIDERILFEQVVAHEDVFSYCKNKLKLTSDFFYSEWAKKIYTALEQIYEKYSNTIDWHKSYSPSTFAVDTDENINEYLRGLWFDKQELMQKYNESTDPSIVKRILNDAIIGIELRKVERERQVVIQSQDVNVSTKSEKSVVNKCVKF